MKPLALAALALSLTGTGCIVVGDDDCNTSTVTLDWSGGFRDADGGALLGCSAAGVQTVNVYVNGELDAGFACSSGSARAVGLPAGSNLITVEGISDGVIAFRAEAFVDGARCGDQRIALTPAEGWVDVQYAFSPVNQCTPNSVMWFSIWDDIANEQAVLVDVNSSPTAYACGSTISFLLPAGDYTFDWMEERAPTTGGYGVTGRDCTDRLFTIAGGSQTIVSPVLADGSTPCAR